MSSSSASRTIQAQKKSGVGSEMERAIFEKIQMNSEEIGKMKIEPFSIATMERCRATYKENEKLFEKLLQERKNTK